MIDTAAREREADSRGYAGGLLSRPCDMRPRGPSSHAGWIAREPRPWIETPSLAYAVGPVDGETPETFEAAWAPELARIAERNARRVERFIAAHPGWVEPETSASAVATVAGARQCTFTFTEEQP